MTFLHPRVGIEVISVNGGGTTDPIDAIPFDVNVGRTVIFVSPKVGWSNGSGLAPGGIIMSGASAGDQVSAIAADVNQYGNGVKIYLPSGDTMFETGKNYFNPGTYNLITIMKTDATTWVVC